MMDKRYYMPQYRIAIHGGAGTIRKEDLTLEQEAAYRSTLKRALLAGENILKSGGTAIDATVESVKVMEDSPLFNAGKGAVFAHNGSHEMDAAIMDGATLDIGAVGLVQGIRNPIVLAEKILSGSEHVLLCGEGVLEFAQQAGVDLAPPEYFHNEFRYQQWQQALKEGAVQLDHTPSKTSKFGTVGAVAMDQAGNLAAATSTGGMTNKKYGRIGDSPLPGCGTYANNRTCAISCTGHGEFFIRGMVAYDVSCLMEYAGKSLREACEEVIHRKQIELGGDGGLIAVSHTGELELIFNSEGMYRGWMDGKGEPRIGIYKEQ
jgi:beta-aspartyl-peptidase (threonine type)